MGRPVEFQVVDDSRLTVRIPEGAESGPFTVTSSWGVVRSLSDFFVGPPPPPTYYTLTVDVVGQGTVARNPDKPAYEAGEIVELTALPAAGWTFVGWSLDSVPSGNPVRTVVMNDNTYVVATFDSLPPTFYTLAVTVVGQGTVTRNPDKPQYQAGEIVELTAIPAPGWTFVGWSLDTVPSGNPVRTVVMNSNQTVTATFAAVPIDSAVAMGFELHPRNLNLDSNGRWVSGVLTPPAPYDATDIDVSSIRLGGSVAVSNEHAVKAQKKDRSLAVKFSRADVERVLASGERVPVVVTGIIGGRPFRGVDYVRTRGGSRTEFPAAGIGEGKAVFALQPSNPIRGALAIRFSLASEAPARLSVFDVTGRRVADRDVAGSDPGWRIVQLGDVPDGIYLVRLSQGGRRLTARVAVIQ
jgi:hypothetical protein